MASVARHILLNSGYKMPVIGLGTYMMPDNSKCAAAMDYALHIGYRHIDTAVLYHNEDIIGDVVNQRIKAGQLKRKDLFITTKLPPTMMAQEDISPCIEESLDKLRTPYVDMLLIHMPFGNKNRGDGDLRPVNENGERELEHHNINVTWQEMELLVLDKQWTRSIGLSNFNISQINQICEKAIILPANVQMECHIYNQQSKLVAFCHAQNIAVTGYAPLGNIEKYKERPGVPMMMEDPVIQQAAAKYKKTPAQILLRFLLQRGIIVTPKSVTPQRMQENLDVFNFNIGHTLFEKIKELDRGYRFFTFEWATQHPEFCDKEPF